MAERKYNLKKENGTTLPGKIKEFIDFLEIIASEDLKAGRKKTDQNDPMKRILKSSVDLRKVLKDLEINNDKTENSSLEPTDILDSLLNHIPAGIAILEGPDLRYVSINQMLADLNGLTVKDHIGRPLKEVLPDAAKNLLPIMRKIIKSGEAVLWREFSIKLPKDPDKEVYLKDYLFPILDEKGRAKGIGAIVFDITHTKEVEISYEKLADILEHAGEMILITDRAGTIEYVNPAFENVTELQSNEVLGKNPRVLKSGKHAKKFYKEMWDTITRGKVWKGIITNKKKSGELYEEEMIITPLKDMDGKITRFVSSGRDITERIHIQNKLQDSEERLRKLAVHLQNIREEERTSLAREIHDELGQLLTAMKMDIQSLMKSIPSDQKALLEKTNSIDDMISLSLSTVRKISSDLRPAILDHLGLMPAIKWQIKEFKKRTNINCKLILPKKEISVDNERSTAVYRLLQEALTNITRHSNASKVKVRIAQKDNMVILEVSDNGRGITREQKSNESTYGLIGMRERVSQWHGSIEINGKKGKGTSLIAKIPLKLLMESK